MFITEGVKNLLIINFIAFLATIILPFNLLQYGALWHPANLPPYDFFEPYQLLTHIFLHGSLGHIFSNMLALWMFGSAMEATWGTKRFLTYYFVCGLGASGLYLLVEYLTIQTGFYPPIVGASGAVFGLLLAFGMTYPNNYINLYFFIPIKAKYFVALYAAIELYAGVSNQYNIVRGVGSTSNVAHFAHLGGMLIGFILITYWFGKKRR
jgi:membrane associated rhomboid family serine protease